MRIHFLQHVPFEGLGHVRKWADHRHDTVTGTLLYENSVLPKPADFDLLVVMGGPMGVYDTSEHPWLTPEKRFIEQALQAEKKIVGICLGAQLIADVLGATVSANPSKEIGWFPVSRTSDAEASDFNSVFPETVHAFHWHGDTFELPKGAIHLAESRACRHQAFYYPPGVLGLQFHLESTAESIELLLHHCGHELVSGPYIQSADRIRSNFDLIGPSNACMERILGFISP
jgi:GMP synthase-like glutamine amidotransferase